MVWTKEQKKVILDGYWATNIAYCPVDNALLDVRKNRGLGRRTDLLQIRCPRCGEHFSSDEIEPEPKVFEEYTPEEKKEIINDYFTTKTGTLPM